VRRIQEAREDDRADRKDEQSGEPEDLNLSMDLHEYQPGQLDWQPKGNR
jgi:hypothetical protein